MRSFDYASPASLDEALGLLAAGATSARPLAGGTDLLTLMKADLLAPQRLVDLKRLPDLPGGVAEDGDGLTIGALATLAELEADARVRERYPALAEAAGLAATPQLRHMATLGGNLLQRPRCWYFRNALTDCWLKGGADCPAHEGRNELHALFGEGPCVAVHPSDPAVALLAIGASVRLRGPEGERSLPLDELFAEPTAERRRETTLGEDELLLAIDLAAPAGARSAYRKAMDRKTWAFALVSAAASLRLEGRRIVAARLVLGGVAPIPWRAEAAERLLVGAEVDDDLLARAAEAALAEARPLAHNGYKRPLAAALVRRALAAAAT